jgi:hypothetical protein
MNTNTQPNTSTADAPSAFLPMEHYEIIARETWWPMYEGDAKDANLSFGWHGLCHEARALGVSTKGHRWNSRKSRLELAKKLLRKRLYDARCQWSRDVSSGKFDTPAVQSSDPSEIAADQPLEPPVAFPAE